MIRNETIDNILSRRTVRQYKPEQIRNEELETLLECAVWAPSARNGQPCRFRVTQDRKLLDEMNFDFKNLVGWDAPAYTNWDKNPFYQNAPTVIFMFSEGDSFMDGGLAAENIAVAAKSMGLGTCIIGSIGALLNSDNGKKWKTKLDIPENYRFLIAVAVGYPDENPEPKPRIENRCKVIKSEE